MSTDTAIYDNIRPSLSGLKPMEVDGVEYPYDIAGILRKFAQQGLRVPQQVEKVEALMDVCIDYEFLEELTDLYARLLNALERVQQAKEQRREVMKNFTDSSQKGGRRASRGVGKSVFKPERVVLDHIPDGEDRRRICLTSHWLRESGMMEGDEDQLAALLGAYPTMPVTEPVVCRKPANMLGYLLLQLQPLLWGRREGMNTVCSDICHAICTAIVQTDGRPYNERSVRTSARQVNLDVHTFFRPLITRLREER